jgi:hypothetical protein
MDLLVPGTSGCKLLANGEDVGWPSGLTAEAWIAGATGFSIGIDKARFSADDLVSLLSMEFADPASSRPTKTSLANDTSIVPGEYLELAYNQFPDFQPFPYDWRSDIRDSSRLLLDRLKNVPAGGRWRIVAHSQGGLLVVAASKQYAAENGDDDTAFARLVSHVAFVATPFHGTVTAAQAILAGDMLTAPFADSFKKIVRTWPAIHQMLPTWPGCVRVKTPQGEVPQPYNLTYDQAWAGLNVSADMLRRARDARSAYFRNPFSRMKNVKLLAWFSEAWGTANRLVVDNGALGSAPAADDELGDTLVPAQTVLSMSNPIEVDRFLMIGRNGNTLKHSVLAIDPVVASGVKAFFGT